MGADLGAEATAAGGPRRDIVDVWAERGVKPTTFADWQAIDVAEIERGAALGRARTKIESWRELLDLCRSAD